MISQIRAHCSDLIFTPIKESSPLKKIMISLFFYLNPAPSPLHFFLYRHLKKIAGPSLLDDIWKVVFQQISFKSAKQHIDFIKTIKLVSKKFASHENQLWCQGLNTGALAIVDLPKSQKQGSIHPFFKDQGKFLLRLDVSAFPSLSSKKMKKIISYCPFIEKLTLCNAILTKPMITTWATLPKLHTLCLINVHLNDLTPLNSLRTLKLKSCTFWDKTIFLANPKTLKNLIIENLFEIEKFSLHELKQLETLKIRAMPKLKYFTTPNINYSLKKLTISNCPELHSVNVLRKFLALEKMDIRNCFKLAKLPLLSKHLQLKQITLKNCSPELKMPPLLADKISEDDSEGYDEYIFFPVLILFPFCPALIFNLNE